MVSAITTCTEKPSMYRQIIRSPVTWLENRGESFGRQSSGDFITMGTGTVPSFDFSAVLHINRECVGE